VLQPACGLSQPEPGGQGVRYGDCRPLIRELFLYVNDAIFLPLKTTLFYCNNEGSARVTVDAVARRPLREAIKSRF